jgi:hypothetical protein
MGQPGTPIGELPPGKRTRLRERYMRGKETTDHLARIFQIKGKSGALHKYAFEHDWIRKSYGKVLLNKCRKDTYSRKVKLIGKGPHRRILQKISKSFWVTYVAPEGAIYNREGIDRVITDKTAQKMIKGGLYTKS